MSIRFGASSSRVAPTANVHDGRVASAGRLSRARPCPGCETPLPEAGACARCGGLWLPAPRVAAVADAGALRRLAGRGPLTSLNCPDCRSALKSFDVPGPLHEGDLFWGLEAARPVGTAVADGCPRCGGLWAAAGDLSRAGGAAAFVENLRRFLGA